MKILFTLGWAIAITILGGLAECLVETLQEERTKHIMPLGWTWMGYGFLGLLSFTIVGLTIAIGYMWRTK